MMYQNNKSARESHDSIKIGDAANATAIMCNHNNIETQEKVLTVKYLLALGNSVKKYENILHEKRLMN